MSERRQRRKLTQVVAESFERFAEEIRSFEEAAEPHWARIHLSQAEMSTLKQTRDALLPRLLSGELSVAGAERVLEAQA